MARVIGIDVSQARLDVYCLQDGRRLAVGNDAAGIATLVGQLELGAGDLLVMEASGGYERAAQRLLSAWRSLWSTPRGCAPLPGQAAAWPQPTASMPR
jgi:hypothetical protein